MAAVAACAAPLAPRPALAAGAASALAFAALNAPFYGYLRRVRGTRFALRAVPWHAAYYASAGVGFALGAARHALTPPNAAPSPIRG